jgi:hypothetical protein
VNIYISRYAEIFLELKAKTDILDVNMHLQLTDADTAIYMGMEEEARTQITREIKLRTQALTFNLISGFHLIAGSKAEIRSVLIKKQGQLPTLALIKDEAVQIEPILEERKRKSAIGTNGTNGNTVIINQTVNEEPNQIEAMINNYRPQHKSQQGQRNQTNRNNGTMKCTHFKKPGQLVEKCFVKFPGLRLQNQSNQ